MIKKKDCPTQNDINDALHAQNTFKVYSLAFIFTKAFTHKYRGREKNDILEVTLVIVRE